MRASPNELSLSLSLSLSRSLSLSLLLFWKVDKAIRVALTTQNTLALICPHPPSSVKPLPLHISSSTSLLVPYPLLLGQWGTLTPPLPPSPTHTLTTPHPQPPSPPHTRIPALTYLRRHVHVHSHTDSSAFTHTQAQIQAQSSGNRHAPTFPYFIYKLNAMQCKYLARFITETYRPVCWCCFHDGMVYDGLPP